MIQIGDGQVEKYMAIYLAEYGKAIDKSQARAELTALVCLVDIVHRHMEKQQWPDVSHIELL